MSGRNKLVFWTRENGLWAGLFGVYLLPIWLPWYLPLTDLPQHLSLVAILRQLSQGNELYRQVFTPQLFPAHNVLHLLFCCGLSWLTGIDVASRIFLTLVALLVPLSFRYLVVRPGDAAAERPLLSLSLLGFLGVYTYNYFWGFVNFALAMAFLFFALGLTIRLFDGADDPQARTPVIFSVSDLRRVLLLALLFLLTFLAHGLAYLFVLAACLLAGLLCRSRPLGFGRGRFRALMLAAAPSLALFLAWAVRQVAIMPQREEPVIRDYHLQELLIRWPRFLSVIAPAREPVSKAIIVLVITVVALLIVRLRRSRQALDRADRALFLTGAAGLLAYFVLPGKVGEASLLNERFAVIGFMLLAAWAARLGSRARLDPAAALSDRQPAGSSVLRVALLVLVLANAANILVRTLTIDRWSRPLRPMLAEIPANRIVMGLPFHQAPRPDLLGYPSWMHAASCYQVDRPGLLGFSFAYARFNSIGYRFPRLLPHIGEWHPWSQIFREQWATYDYFVCTGDSEPLAMAPGHGLEVRRHEGTWVLLANAPKRRAYDEAVRFVRDSLLPGEAEPVRSFILPAEIDRTYFSELTDCGLPFIDLWLLSRRLVDDEESWREDLPAIVLWLQGDNRGYQPLFRQMNGFQDFETSRLRFRLLFRAKNGLIGVYRLSSRD